jgi:hypothetical protein
VMTIKSLDGGWGFVCRSQHCYRVFVLCDYMSHNRLNNLFKDF